MEKPFVEHMLDIPRNEGWEPSLHLNTTPSSFSSATASVAVYGLSTEGYRVASSIALKGSKVSLIDESARMAITLKPDIARTYPDVSSKFKDATKAVRPGASIIFTLPTGIGGNNENIALIEHITGLSVGKDIFYYYMPINTDAIMGPGTLIGSLKSRQDTQITNMLYDPDMHDKLNYVNVISAEFIHSIKVLGHYTGMASILEICKHGRDTNIRREVMHHGYREIYLDDVANGLYDLRAIGSSLGGAGPLMYLVNGALKGIEGYIKHLIDEIRDVLRKRDLKASRTKVAIAWTLDPNEMRGDKIELLASLESKLKDYIGDVERQEGPSLDIYPVDKTTISLACTKNDFAKILSKNKQIPDCILMKAN